MKQLKHSYSDDISNKKVMVFGLIPPPLGGISVHIKRVIYKLEQQNNTVWFINAEQPWYILPFYIIKLLFVCMYFRPNVIMFNSVYLKHSLIQLSFLSFLKRFMQFKLLCIEHNCRHMYTRTKIWKRFFSKILKIVDMYVFIGTSTYKSYKDNNVEPINVSIESAFLPPRLQDEAAIVKSYPQELLLFLHKKAPLVLVNAFQLILLHDNQDLYGIDQSLEMLRDLTKTYPDAGLIFALAKVGDQDYFEQLKEKIKQYNLQQNIFILSGQKELWPLFKQVDLFVRPTLSDGASISIEEAFYFNVPVVASNVVERQKGVVLFDPNIKYDLLNKVIHVFSTNKDGVNIQQLYF